MQLCCPATSPPVRISRDRAIQMFADQAAIASRMCLFKRSKTGPHLDSRAKRVIPRHMSHELRTPESIIVSLTLLTDIRRLERPADRPHDILASGKHQLALINDVLACRSRLSLDLNAPRSSFAHTFPTRASFSALATSAGSGSRNR